jgi:UDP-4-amino-4,6-dideoxy-N-acetyl-beta-L-altrosamine N-acetyltransferase
MKLQKYGVTLDRLRKEDIEMVRKYRNSAEIRNLMHFKKFITRRMQRNWFASIDNSNNFYFIITYEGKKIGLINIKNIDWKNFNTSESGLFLWDPLYIDSPAPLLASIILSEFGYGFLRGTESKIKILINNFKAINFNKALGYELCNDLPGEENMKFYLQTKESFIRCTSAIRKKALTFCNNNDRLYLYAEHHDKESGLAKIFYNYLARAQYSYNKRMEGDTEIYGFLFDFS